MHINSNTTWIDQITRQRIRECKRNPPVSIKPSKRHGYGVFANRDIIESEPVAFYDGVDVIGPNHISLEEHKYSLNYIPSWLPSHVTEKTRLGYRVPKTSYGVGSLINDSCCPELEKLVDKEKLQISSVDALECIKNYSRKSKAVSMVYLDTHPDCKLWLFAARNIRKDEEIVMTYGSEYWSKQLLAQTTFLAVPLVLSTIYERDFYIKQKKNMNSEADVNLLLDRYGLKLLVDEEAKYHKHLNRGQFLMKVVRLMVVA